MQSKSCSYYLSKYLSKGIGVADNLLAIFHAAARYVRKHRSKAPADSFAPAGTPGYEIVPTRAAAGKHTLRYLQKIGSIAEVMERCAFVSECKNGLALTQSEMGTDIGYCFDAVRTHTDDSDVNSRICA